MTHATIALIGISGVGKSSLLGALSEAVTFQHLQAGHLIKAAREALQQGIAHDDLRQADINDNQTLLVQGFRAARDTNAAIVVLDGHSVVDTPAGMIAIEPTVFEALGITQFILVIDDPAEIHRRRTADLSRNRPPRSLEDLDVHQREALLSAFAAARHLAVPLHVFPVSSIDAIRDVLLASKPPPRG